MKKVLLIIISVFLGIICGVGGVLLLKKLQDRPKDHIQEEFDKKYDVEAELDLVSFSEFEKSHFGFMHPQMAYAFVEELEVHWQRPHPGPFIWRFIESEKGVYNWDEADRYVKKSQYYDIVIMATIWPYADWDQPNCNSKLPSLPREDFPELGDYRSKPCDNQAYSNFVQALVERYDGDGISDMPNLKYPIKYWEVINEPDLGLEEENELIFFLSDDLAGDYFEVLKITYNAVKQADRSAYVINGGMAGLGGDEMDFWQEVLSGEGKDYVDIISNHSVSGPRDLGIEALKELMSNLSLNQPFWITEVQFGRSGFEEEKDSGIIGSVFAEEVDEDFPVQNLSEEEWAEYLVKTYVEAFTQGAGKLFYTSLESHFPGERNSALVSCDEGDFVEKEKDMNKDEVEKDKENHEDMEFDIDDCTKQRPYYAFETMVEKIDYFDSVEKLDEGQYKFFIDNEIVYVLWGAGEVPSEISGQVEVTDIYGESRVTQVESLYLTDTPVYVEVL